MQTEEIFYRYVWIVADEWCDKKDDWPQIENAIESLPSADVERDRHYGMKGILNIGENSDPITVVAVRAGPTVGFTVHLNVLSPLHSEETRDFAGERSRTDNWLHPDAVENSDPVWQRLYLEIIEHEIHMAELANEVATGITPGGIATIQNIRVNRIELCADFATLNPHAVMRSMAPRFKGSKSASTG